MLDIVCISDRIQCIIDCRTKSVGDATKLEHLVSRYYSMGALLRLNSHRNKNSNLNVSIYDEVHPIG